MNRESSSGKSIKYEEADNRLGQKVNESFKVEFRSKTLSGFITRF